jgi:hypothetical protein
VRSAPSGGRQDVGRRSASSRRYGCEVPIATLISRAAARYLGVGAQTVVRELARVAAREARAGAGARGGAAAGVPAAVPVPGRVARGVFALWVAGLALFVLVVLNIDLFLPDGVATSSFRLVVGLVLLIEAVALLPRQSPFRLLLVARLTAGSLRHPSRLRRTAWKHLIGTGLTLIGFAWVAAGMLNVLRGAIALV